MTIATTSRRARAALAATAFSIFGVGGAAAVTAVAVTPRAAHAQLVSEKQELEMGRQAAAVRGSTSGVPGEPEPADRWR